LKIEVRKLGNGWLLSVESVGMSIALTEEYYEDVEGVVENGQRWLDELVVKYGGNKEIEK
jgi:hypothetical protein